MFEYLTSLDVKQDKSFFYRDIDYSPGIYKTENNYEYSFKLYVPSDKEFQSLSNKLKINGIHNDSDFYYISRVPILIKIEERYFTKEDKVIQLARFINNFIQLYEYFFNDFGIPEFLMDGRIILNKQNSVWENLDYSNIHSIDFYHVIKESIVDMDAPSELLTAESAHKDSLDISWKLFLDGVKSLHKGDFRQALINCTSAVEVEISGPIYDWFTDKTLRDVKGLVKKLMYDLSNPLRFEIYVKTINPEPFTIYSIDELKEISKGFEKLNSIRNKVAHSGYFPTLEETKKALETTGFFLRALWINKSEDGVRWVE